MEFSPRRSHGDGSVNSSGLLEVYAEELPLDPSRRCHDAFAVAWAFTGSNTRLGGVRPLLSEVHELRATRPLSEIHEVRATRQISEAVYRSEELLLIHESDAAPVNRPVRVVDGIGGVVAGMECPLVLLLCPVRRIQRGKQFRQRSGEGAIKVLGLRECVIGAELRRHHQEVAVHCGIVSGCKPQAIQFEDSGSGIIAKARTDARGNCQRIARRHQPELVHVRMPGKRHSNNAGILFNDAQKLRMVRAHPHHCGCRNLAVVIA